MPHRSWIRAVVIPLSLIIMPLGQLLAAVPGHFTLSQPTALCRTVSTEPEIDLSWGAASGVVSYDVYRNGAAIYTGILATAPTTFFNYGSLVAGQSYTYFIQAKNSSGATNSNTVTVAVPVKIYLTHPKGALYAPSS